MYQYLYIYIKGVKIKFLTYNEKVYVNNKLLDLEKCFKCKSFITVLLEMYTVCTMIM